MATARASHKPPTLRTIWGIAKSKELAMTEDDLRNFVFQRTSKSSLKSLSQGEINTITSLLLNLKDGANRDVTAKRTDVGGDPRTVPLRRKIYALCNELGWNNDNRRINGFVIRMFKVERIEWLNMPQCTKLTEALKAMVERQRGGAVHE